MMEITKVPPYGYIQIKQFNNQVIFNQDAFETLCIFKTKIDEAMASGTEVKVQLMHDIEARTTKSQHVIIESTLAEKSMIYLFPDDWLRLASMLELSPTVKLGMEVMTQILKKKYEDLVNVAFIRLFAEYCSQPEPECMHTYIQRTGAQLVKEAANTICPHEFVSALAAASKRKNISLITYPFKLRQKRIKFIQID